MNGAARRLLPTIVVNGAIPLIAYLAVRSHVGSEAVALAIGGAIPALFTVGGFLVQRKLDKGGVISVIGFGLALLIALLSGGNALVLKLHDAVISGPIGLLFLASLATRRPLMVLVKQLTERGKPAAALPSPRAMYVFTALIGAMLTVHAAVILGLALALPTTTFLAVGRPIGWVVLAIGAAALLWYRNKLRAAAQIPA
ncbi:MAG TPA: VC0807 family protein [Mycobacteriales bacterium]|nr:VC0807 family protein [Mycobacteriales bacterium]